MNTILEQEDVEISDIDTKKTVEAMTLINSIDLSMVKMKLMDKEEGQGWDEEFAVQAEWRYRRYLCLNFLYPEKSVVPTQDIDQFWHQHILDTRAYANDTQRVFGEFLHHYPYFGMRDEQDAQDLLDSFEETKILYMKHFHEELCVEYNSMKAGACHKGPGACHKCASKPGGCTDTIKCTRCKK